MKYRFIEKHQTMYPVEQQCCALGVSRSGYYAWRERQKKGKGDSYRALIEHIRRIHNRSRRTYGSPRIHAELRAEGVVCNHKRVARWMRLEPGSQKTAKSDHNRLQTPLSGSPKLPQPRI